MSIDFLWSFQILSGSCIYYSSNVKFEALFKITLLILIFQFGWVYLLWKLLTLEVRSNSLSDEGMQQHVSSPQVSVVVSAAMWAAITVGDCLLLWTAAEYGHATSQISCRRMWCSSPSSAAAISSLEPMSNILEAICLQPSLYRNNSVASVPSYLLEQERKSVAKTPFPAQTPVFCVREVGVMDYTGIEQYTSWSHHKSRA